MLRNYVKIAMRNLARYKVYSLINIAGLAVGIACCVLIFLWVYNELSFDRYHENADNIYRLRTDADFGGLVLDMPKFSPPAADYLVNNYPEVLQATRFYRMDKTPVKYGTNQFYEERVFFADNSVFDMFSFPMVKGDPRSALATAYSVVITEDMAQKYFYGDDPVDKVLTFNDEDYTVTGVIRNIPNNSHFTFDMLCSFETLYERNRQNMEQWLNINYNIYFLLQENYDYKKLEQKFPEMIDTHLTDKLKTIGGSIEIYLQPLTSIHLHSHLQQEISPNGNIIYVYVYSAIAAFILIIACINFINLTTARSTNRAQEVGIRKVLGADRAALIRQFLGESFVYTFISLIIALLLVKLSLPLFGHLIGRDLSFMYNDIPWLLPGIIGLMIFVGLCTGSYPAFFLSSLRPIHVIKGNLKSGAAHPRIRSLLVIVQFSISIILIIGTSIIFNQLNFIKDKTIGFDKDEIVVLPISNENIAQSLITIKSELKTISGIVDVAASSHVPGQTTYKNPVVPDGYTEDNAQWMGMLNIDHDFIPLMGIELIAGRNFARELRTDAQGSVLINETALKLFGWDDAIGKNIRALGGDPSRWGDLTVIGVVKDFHMTSLHYEIEPLLIYSSPTSSNTICVKVSKGNLSSTMDLLKKKWEEIDPDNPFDYFFLDEFFDSQYRADERLSIIFSYFSLLAVFIACLGLYGLASFTAEQRKREIGIRKVLGASISGIVFMLSKEFMKWVLIANIIAWPVVWVAMNRWLENFAYRIDFDYRYFISAGIIALVIAMITVSYQAVKAGMANPVDSLRNE